MPKPPIPGEPPPPQPAVTSIALFPLAIFRQKFIIPHEGQRLVRYKDSLGIWTIAEGFNLEQSGAKETCAKYGIDWDACMADQPITEEQCASLTMHTICLLVPAVRKLIPRFDLLSMNRQMAILDVAWVGIGTFSKFAKMIAAINADNWNEAAAELLDSKLAKQWGRRAQEDARILREG